MTRRSLSSNEIIDEIDSPVDGLEDGSLSIPAQTTGNVTGNQSLNHFIFPIFKEFRNVLILISDKLTQFCIDSQVFGAVQQQ